MVGIELTTSCFTMILLFFNFHLLSSLSLSDRFLIFPLLKNSIPVLKRKTDQIQFVHKKYLKTNDKWISTRKTN